MELTAKETRSTHLFKLAKEGNISILLCHDVDKHYDCFLKTPLHYLALCGRVEIITHPSFNKIKDLFGKTPEDYYTIFSRLHRESESVA